MASANLTKNVYLIGFMGAGKSTVARRLARIYGISSLDMDKYIERAQGKTIPEIFAESGESGFRAVETSTLKDIAAMEEPLVVSCGGGIVLRPENRDIMRDDGFVVHLCVDADEASSRISDKSSRPLFNDIESARQLCQDRLPVYENAADATVMTGGRDVSDISREVSRILKDEGILVENAQA